MGEGRGLMGYILRLDKTRYGVVKLSIFAVGTTS